MRPYALLLLLGLPAFARGADDFEALLEEARAGQIATVEALTDAMIAAGSDGDDRWRLALDQLRPERELLFPEEASAPLSVETLTALERIALQVPQELALRLPQLDLTRGPVAAQIGLGLLAHQGDLDDFALCLQLATPHPELEYAQHRPIGGDLAATVTALLSRHSRGYPTVSRSFGAGHGWLDIYLLRGIGGTRDARALRALPGLLSVVPELDASTLIEVGNVARQVDAPLDRSAGQRVRMYLSSFDVEERKQAAIAVGRLNDYEAVQSLIELLSDDDRGVRTNSYWALREITAMTINSEPRRWRLWFDDETGWWAAESAQLLANLGHPDPAEVCRAINECARKRLFRRQLTPALVSMLDHTDPTVVRATCSALFALQATDAAARMVAVMEHSDPLVAAHALAMLERLTGRQDLLPTPAAWRAALDGSTPSAR